MHLDGSYLTYTIPKPDRCRWGHSNQFNILAPSSHIYGKAFFPWTKKSWNNLQLSTIAQSCLTTFKAAVLNAPVLPPPQTVNTFSWEYFEETNQETRTQSRESCITMVTSFWLVKEMHFFQVTVSCLIVMNFFHPRGREMIILMRCRQNFSNNFASN